MENIIYRIEMSDDFTLEFYVCDTNELDPHRDIKEIGISVFSDDQQIDGDISEARLEAFIKYLTDCKEHISKFNKDSKPTKNP